ncbi:cell cycle transcriptional regulator TrcR, partial [Paracoccus sp. (in: a-proteobacteria)]|uniref:cell cycle transcriptional regulator TrcR n=1 Tax=Paracoccus sp. TaxID=267 RepID=UPI0028AD61C3
MNKPLMAKATAVWLVDNTTLSFKQIADFCGMHELEVQGIADGDVAVGVKGFDPVASSQLDASEIEKGQKDPRY